MNTNESSASDENAASEITDDMIIALIRELKNRYLPAVSPEYCDEMKSHIDLIEEFETFSPVDPDRLFRLMQESGFHPHYTGDGFYWLLKSV